MTTVTADGSHGGAGTLLNIFTMLDVARLVAEESWLMESA